MDPTTDYLDNANFSSTTKINDLSSSTGYSAFVKSFLVIVVSEIGDKTFIIAAVLAMQHSRLLIFSAAISALGIMTVLSALAGAIFPQLISKLYTQILVSILFIFFGLKMIKEGLSMNGAEAKEELDQVTNEIDKKHQNSRDELLEKGLHSPRISSSSSEDIPDASILDKQKPSPPKSPSKTKTPLLSSSPRKTLKNILHIILSPVWIEAFVMTFLAEWGDRSQISTIALAGSDDLFFVTVGALAGHALCSAIAVIGGKLLATRISIRSVTIIGAFLFLVFGLLGLYQCIYVDY